MIFLSVTSPSGHFWLVSYCFLLSTDVCMYMKQQLHYLRFHFSFSRGAATRPLPWPHAVLWCRFELYSLTCWSTVLSAMCCHTLNVQSTVTTSCILPKKTTVLFPSLYVSTKENTMHKLGVMSFTWQCLCILMHYPNNSCLLPTELSVNLFIIYLFISTIVVC